MLKTILAAVFGGAMTLIAFAGAASAETTTFTSPKHHGNLVDWCRDWGVDCGQPAADQWCQSIGYQSAVGFEEAYDVGASSPTRLIGTGAVCDQAYCDAFTYITCTRPDPTQTFVNPTYNGNRLDWCQNWGVGCGKAAADQWCQTVGFSHATTFSIANNIGLSAPTRLIGTGAVCDQDFCDGFQKITCSH